MSCHWVRMGRGYVISIAIDNTNSLHSLTRLVQLHLAQFLSSLGGNIIRGVNKASSNVQRVETACPLKRDQQSIKPSPAYTHPSTTRFHSNYIKYPCTLDHAAISRNSP